jgi:hypothetical protein
MNAQAPAVRISTITPEMATVYLAHNDSNRPLSERSAKKLANAILRGEWKMNGDCIRISSDGVLLDGQHRLRAIQIANQPVQTMVVEGLSSDVFATIDQGVKRTPAHILALEGFKESSNLAAAARQIILYRTYSDPFCRESDRLPSAQQISETVHTSPELVGAVSRAHSSEFLTRFIGVGTAAFLLTVFAEKNPIQAEIFFQQIMTGVGLTIGMPAYTVREQLIRAKVKTNYGQRQVNGSLKAGWMFAAYRAFLAERNIKIIQIKSSKASEIFYL